MRACVRVSVAASVLWLHLAPVVGAWPQPILRINAQPNSVARSDAPSDYGLTVVGDDLYAIWVGHAPFGMDVYVSKVNLSTGIRGDDLKVTARRARGKGARIFPAVHVAADDTHFSWLEKAVRRTEKRGLRYYVLNTISRTSLESGGEPDVVDYGVQSRPPRFVATSHGLFLVGHIGELESRTWDLRIYRDEKGGFREVQALSGDPTWGREPTLVENRGVLFLFWVRSDAIVVSTSDDGVEWTPAAEVAGGQRVRSGTLKPVAAGDGWKLVWATNDKGSSRLLYVHGKPGDWSEPRELTAMHKTLPSLVFGLDSGLLGTLIVSYMDADERSQVLISLREVDSWKPIRLSPQGESVQTSREPTLQSLSGQTFLAWSQSDRSSPQAMASRIYLNQITGGQTGWLEAPRQISGENSDYSNLTPKLFSHGGKLFVTYFSYRMKTSGLDGFPQRMMANPNRGNLHLRQVEFEGKQEGTSER